MPKLLWLAHDVGDYRRIQARVAEDAAYDIDPQFGYSRWAPFVGYDVRHVTLRNCDPKFCDDPKYAEDEDIRVIATRVKTEDEARAIAQADADKNPVT